MVLRGPVMSGILQNGGTYVGPWSDPVLSLGVVVEAPEKPQAC